MHGFLIVSQTISSSSVLLDSTFLKKRAQLPKIIGILVISLSLLTSCSSQAPKKNDIVTSPISQDIEPQSLDAEKIILLTQQMITDEANADVINIALENLSKASTLYVQEGNYSKAIWLTEQTLQLHSPISSINSIANDQLSPQEKTQLAYQANQIIALKLIKSQSLQALNYYELSEQPLKEVLTLTQQHNLALNYDYYQLQSELLQFQNRAIDSLQASLHAFALNTQRNEETFNAESLLLWQKISMLSPWQVELLSKREAPHLKGWLALNRYANKFGGDSEQLSRYIRQWQRKNPQHPANNIAADLSQQQISKVVFENIAVILPLTGKQQNAGIALQQGLLAAFEQDNLQQEGEKSLHFFDSNKLNWPSLPSQFRDQKIDFVIGPLLKSSIDKYLELTLTSTDLPQGTNLDAKATVENNNPLLNKDNTSVDTITVENNPISSNKSFESSLVIDLPTLLLNLPNQEIASQKHIAFSMRPEDEAIQAAATLSQIGFKEAIVLSHKDTVSQRIAKAFVNEWKNKTKQSLEVVYFEQGKSMQNNLEASLDVKASQNRIDELQGRVKQTIKSQTRNRRDIDMIYVIGSPQQTRLVKPYIDVNISPFSSLIPIYASSRSHSMKNDTSSTNDLQGLTFTEIPWLLTSKEQNKGLANLSKKLWPKRRDSLSRLFAMGFDSYNLVNKVNLMQQAPYIHYFGQTGVLKLNNHILTRSFIWGKYQNNGVSQITLN